MGLSMTKKELASVAGYTYRRLYDIDRDLPENKKLFVQKSGDSTKCDLAIFVQHWVDYNISAATKDITDLESARTKHEIVKIKKTELEVSRLEGRLVDVREIKLLWGGIANHIMQSLIRVPNKVAPLLLMLDNAEEIAQIIDDEIRATLMDLDKVPLPEDTVVSESETGGDDE